MHLGIERLTKDREPGYADLLRRIPESLVFQSLRYRDFLARLLVSSEERYLVAIEGGTVVGALPAFLKKNPRHGNVLNSLPFYGSNGGVLVEPSQSNPSRVQRALVEAFQEVAETDQVVASTVVSSPLAPLDELYRATTKHTLEEDRTGQLTRLPAVGPGEGDGAIGDALMAIYHPKTRNLVRKALLSGAVVGHDASLESMRALASLHEENMRAMGGLSKPWAVFDAVRSAFEYDVDYRVYSAKLDGRTISALLVFFHNGVCEYYTPATVAQFRSLQLGSLLVYHAMREALNRGCTHWNWGGTWLTQKGVYDFKSKWGTYDVPYRYYVREYARSELRSLDRETLLREYPYYYTIPFASLADR